MSNLRVVEFGHFDRSLAQLYVIKEECGLESRITRALVSQLKADYIHGHIWQVLSQCTINSTHIIALLTRIAVTENIYRVLDLNFV